MMLPHWTESYLTIEGHKFHYYRTGMGDKPALVLLHGFSDNGLCWLPLARDLEADYDLIMPDARGHGLSARVQPGEQIDGAADAAGLIEQLNLQKPVVIGHSMGGQTATQLAARYPQLTGGLILEDPAWLDPSPDGPHGKDNPFFHWLMNIDQLSQDDIIAIGKADNPTWPEIEFPAWAESKTQLDKTIFDTINFLQPWRESVAAIQAPTLLVTGDPQKFIIVTPGIAQEAVSLSPFIRVVSVPGAGHSIRRENYPAYLAAVKTFLQSLA